LRYYGNATHELLRNSTTLLWKRYGVHRPCYQGKSNMSQYIFAREVRFRCPKKHTYMPIRAYLFSPLAYKWLLTFCLYCTSLLSSEGMGDRNLFRRSEVKFIFQSAARSSANI
jgi:hypothetical protein